MKNFWKGLANVAFYTVSAALLIYATSRSLDFILLSLPPNQQVIGYLGLAATSGGMLAWLLLFIFKAEGTGQRVTTAIMTVLDMLGEFYLFSMDTLYQSGKAGMISGLTGEDIRLVVLILSGLVAINILATVIFHLLDPENIKQMREASVRDQLEQMTLKEIENRGKEIAERLAPRIAKQWADDFEKRFEDMQSLGLGSPRPVEMSRPSSGSTEHVQEAERIVPLVAGARNNGSNH